MKTGVVFCERNQSTSFAFQTVVLKRLSQIFNIFYQKRSDSLLVLANKTWHKKPERKSPHTFLIYIARSLKIVFLCQRFLVVSHESFLLSKLVFSYTNTYKSSVFKKSKAKWMITTNMINIVLDRDSIVSMKILNYNSCDIKTFNLNHNELRVSLQLVVHVRCNIMFLLYCFNSLLLWKYWNKYLQFVYRISENIYFILSFQYHVNVFERQGFTHTILSFLWLIGIFYADLFFDWWRRQLLCYNSVILWL